jgi:hypothetical protein
MNVIVPIVITDTNFTYSNVPEPDTSVGEALWVAATSYTLSQEVVRPNHNKYKNILAGIDAGLPENTPARWTKSGVSNKWAAADNLRNTQSSAPVQYVAKFMPTGLIDAISLVGVEGVDVLIEVRKDAVLIYSYAQNLYYRTARNWFDWAFKPFRKANSVVRLDIPLVSNCEITITINNPSAISRCGGVIFGRKQYIGKIKYASSGSALNFSKFERNFDSTISQIIPRPSKPTVSAQLVIEKAYVNDMLYLQEQLNAVPTVWTGLDDDNINDFYQLFLINGLYKQFDINADFPSHATINLELEEF